MCRPSKIDSRCVDLRCEIRLLQLLAQNIDTNYSCMRISPRVCTSVLSLLCWFNSVYEHKVCIIIYNGQVSPTIFCQMRIHNYIYHLPPLLAFIFFVLTASNPSVVFLHSCWSQASFQIVITVLVLLRLNEARLTTVTVSTSLLKLL